MKSFRQLFEKIGCSSSILSKLQKENILSLDNLSEKERFKFNGDAEFLKEKFAPSTENSKQEGLSTSYFGNVVKTFWLLNRLYFNYILYTTIVGVIVTLLELSSFQMLTKFFHLLETIENDSNLNQFFKIGLFYCLLHSILHIISSIISSYLDQYQTEYNLKYYLFLNSYLTKKLLSLHLIVKNKYNYGSMQSITSRYTMNIVDIMQKIGRFWSNIIRIFILIYYLYNKVDFWPTFGSLCVLLIALPIYRYYLSKNHAMWKRIGRTHTEKNFLLSQIVLSIRFVKIYVLENYFQKKLDNLRTEKEKRQLETVFYSNIFSTIWYLKLFLVTSVCLYIYCYLQENILILSVALAVVKYITMLRDPMNSIIYFSQSLNECKTSLDNVMEFLNEKEYITTNVMKEDNSSANNVERFDESVVKINELSANWSFDKEQPPILNNISLTIKKGEFLAIIGKIGQGKSTLLFSILGETNFLNGNVTITKKDLTFAFVSQNPWIRKETIKENILFGLEYNEDRYRKAIYGANFEIDLEQFKLGDLSIIGERGINLSGGQKARLALARAIYQNVDCYIIDDVLSAVDIHTSQNILERTFVGENALLKGKTILLTTHQLHFIDKVDRIVVLNSGKIEQVGTYNELMKLSEYDSINDNEEGYNNSSSTFKELMKNTRIYETNIFKEEEKEEIDEGKKEEKESKKQEKKKEEEKKEEYASFQLIINFLLSLGYLKSGSLLLIILSTFGIEYLLKIYRDFIMTEWSTHKEQNINIVTYYLIKYNLIGLSEIILTILAGYIYHLFANNLSYLYYKKLTNQILHAKIQLFEENPSGKVIKYFHDVDSIYNILKSSFLDALKTLTLTILSLIYIFYSFPIFIPLSFPLILISRYYRSILNKEKKRLEGLSSESHAPVISISNEILDGIDTIRSFMNCGKKEVMEKEVKRIVKRHFDLRYSKKCLELWFRIRIDIVRNTFQLLGLILSLFYYPSMLLQNNDVLVDSNGYGADGSGMVNLFKKEHVVATVAIVVLFHNRLYEFVGNIERILHTLLNAANDFLTVERVQHFLQTSTLENYENNERNNHDWKVSEGTIVFNNISMRYRKDRDLVLKNVSFMITSGKKLAIIGRTGSGKSSIMNCLLRLQEIEQANNADISIDGTNIRNIPLKTLRSQLSFIPQQPILLNGTIRENLDFEKKFNDEEMLQVMKTLGLDEIIKKKVLNNNDKNLLNVQVSENGSNFSSGERQLICLARAMLRKSKILLLDEATSSVDLQTDQLIQNTLRGSFFKECTIITIAHRLETVKDYDKIIVMENGCVKSVDSPQNIIN